VVGGRVPPSFAVLRCRATVSPGQSEHRRPKSIPIGPEKIDPNRVLFQKLFGRSLQTITHKPISQGFARGPAGQLPENMRGQMRRWLDNLNVRVRVALAVVAIALTIVVILWL